MESMDNKMSLWYRITKMDKESAFSGDGGLQVEGRWHHKGNKVVYCSQSLALCALEVISNYGLTRVENYFRYSISIPEALINSKQVTDLPRNWNAYPSAEETRDFTDTELFSGNFLALKVPSSIIQEEYNLIINPTHNEYSKSKATIKQLGKFTFPVKSNK